MIGQRLPVDLTDFVAALHRPAVAEQTITSDRAGPGAACHPEWATGIRAYVGSPSAVGPGADCNCRIL